MEDNDNEQQSTTVKRETSSVADIICEFLEISINLILYIRGVYPDGIFRKCQKYGIAAMMSCHPELNMYIKDVLIGIRSLILAGNVERVNLHINTKDDTPIERFVFELQFFEHGGTQISSHIQGIEQYLRDLLLKINACDALLKPLPKSSDDCTFAVTVETKQSVANDMVNFEHFEGFPWVNANKDDKGISIEQSTIMPLKSCVTNLFHLQCFVEENAKFPK
eukprot:Seg3414.2 transcript_id=Seg3414.2/GoldUCD/mRNA.D3Y31 product="Mitotic spindle assembly checkpoint protein MAD2B" protein_id=Seg3414.2/GoldUCD/D3Y31